MSQTIAVTEEWPKKFRVKCDSCRVSQTYYTEVGVRYFKSQHSGHRVTGGSSSALEEISEDFHPVRSLAPVKRDVPSTTQAVNEILPTVGKDLLQDKKNLKIETMQSMLPKIPGEEVKLPNKPKVVSVQSAQNKPALSKATSKINAEQAPLLLGKFSFVKEGENYKAEAARISGVLRSFRWKVEPPYVIGALFDENLSVQSNTGVLSREVIMGIEQLGYYFVAAECPKGIMTAWFKKGAEE